MINDNELKQEQTDEKTFKLVLTESELNIIQFELRLLTSGYLLKSCRELRKKKPNKNKEQVYNNRYERLLKIENKLNGGEQ